MSGLRRAPLALLLAAVLLLSGTLPLSPAHAAGPWFAAHGPAGAVLPQATDTPAPTPTVTPTAFAESVIALDSGEVVVLEHRATDGEKAIFLALIVLIALIALRWLFDLALRFLG